MEKDSTINEIVVATQNQDKFSEIAYLFSNLGIKCSAPNIEYQIEENGSTFLENATIKATEVAKLLKSYSLADDSGLVVEALFGRPGIHSSRYAHDDDEKISKLLEEMKGVNNRSAEYICSMVFSDPNGKVLYSTSGQCKGKIALSPKGNNGFGFDPIFYIPLLGCTMAELTLEDKNKMSHRQKALRSMLEWVKLNYQICIFNQEDKIRN